MRSRQAIARQLKISVKGLLRLATAILLILAMATGVFAMGDSGDTSGDDTAEMLNSFDTYMTDYLPGFPEDARSALHDYIKDGLENSPNLFFMPMMSTFASIRKAGQSGEAEGISDVMTDFASLSPEAQDNVVARLTEAFESIQLSVAYENAKMILTKDGETFAEIPLGEASIDITALYFEAYLPEFPEESIADVKALISEYASGGGGPSGSGALWRCIREVGDIMGRIVEMAGDYTAYTVKEEGTLYFSELDDAQREKVIDKVAEGMTGIAVTSSYKDGKFTFTKKGEVQFTYTPIGMASDAVETGAPETTAAPSDAETATEPKQDNGAILYIVLGAAAVVLILAVVVVRGRSKGSAK